MQTILKTLNTPLGSSTLLLAQQPLSIQYILQFLELLKVAIAINILFTSTSTLGGLAVKLLALEDFKTEVISQVYLYSCIYIVLLILFLYSWDEKAYQYKIAEPVALTGEVNELN
jgi:hypothetical protein